MSPQSGTRRWRCRPCQSQSPAATWPPRPPTAWSGRTPHTCRPAQHPAAFSVLARVPCLIAGARMRARIHRQKAANASVPAGSGFLRKTHPPAGPDRIALWPEKASTGARPPSDCIKDSCTSRRPASKPFWNAVIYLAIKAGRCWKKNEPELLEVACHMIFTCQVVAICGQVQGRAAHLMMCGVR